VDKQPPYRAALVPGSAAETRLLHEVAQGPPVLCLYPQFGPRLGQPPGRIPVAAASRRATSSPPRMTR